MGLVATWLEGIGMAYAVPTFTAAGIVTPDALAELDVAHFEALGVRTAEDRRKLFYLVQRVRMAVDDKKKDTLSSSDKVNAVLAASEEQLYPNNNHNNSQAEASSPVSHKENHRNNHAYQQQQEEHDDEEDEEEAPRSPTNRSQTSNGSRSPRRTSRQSPQQQQQQQQQEEEDEDDDEDSREWAEYNGGQVAVETAPSMASSNDSASSSLSELRRSKRIMEKQRPKISGPFGSLTASSNSNAGASSQRPPSQVRTTTTSTTTNNRNGARDQDKGTRYGSPRRTSQLRPSNTTSSTSTATTTATTSTSRYGNTAVNNRRSSTGKAPQPKLGSFLKKTETPVSQRPVSGAASVSDFRRPTAVGRRSTGLQAPSSRRTDPAATSSSSSTMRTARTSLPAGDATLRSHRTTSIADASTRTTRTVVAVDTAAASRSEPVRRGVPKTRSMEGKQVGGRTERRQSQGRTGSTSRPTTAATTADHDRRQSRGRAASTTRPTDTADRRQSRGRAITTTRPTDNTSSASVRSNRQSLEPSRRSSVERAKSPMKTLRPSHSTVSYQGRKEDDSFKAQIVELREDNNADYELFRPESTEPVEEDMRIRVLVRKRPMSRTEIAVAGDIDVIHPLDYNTYGRLLVYQPKTRVDLTKSIETIPFAFDNVFDDDSTNQQIYERAIRYLIPALFEEDGQWASIFAYGQTGSGKTFTMMGSSVTGIRDGSSRIDPSNLGLYYMAALDVFAALKMPGFETFSVAVSLFEIYGGKLFDLLNDKQQVKCLEDSNGKVCFPGLSEHSVGSPDELMSLIEHGASMRSTGTTSRNADSSRSHAVLQLHLLNTRGRKTAEHSRLTFIDLAGSERGADTNKASKATRLEGAEINTSLLALKEVIRALATGDSLTHVPFRGSKLTQVLKESFVGKNCRSVMIACISPNIGNCEQTLNTLRYADRVKERNAETGQAPANIQAPPPLRQRRAISSDSLDSDAVLDDLLASPPSSGSHLPLPEKQPDDNDDDDDDDDELFEPEPSLPVSRAPVKESPLTGIGAELVAEHKASMSIMLDMVKDEMTLVNEADSTQGLADYVAQLSSLQDEQLTLIANLRERLLQYRLAAKEQDMQRDESFEDLRD